MEEIKNILVALFIIWLLFFGGCSMLADWFNQNAPPIGSIQPSTGSGYIQPYESYQEDYPRFEDEVAQGVPLHHTEEFISVFGIETTRKFDDIELEKNRHRNHLLDLASKGMSFDDYLGYHETVVEPAYDELQIKINQKLKVSLGDNPARWFKQHFSSYQSHVENCHDGLHYRCKALIYGTCNNCGENWNWEDVNKFQSLWPSIWQ